MLADEECYDEYSNLSSCSSCEFHIPIKIKVTQENAMFFITTLTCSLEVTAQKTISAKFCEKFFERNALKQMPPITRFSLIRARE